MTNGSCWRFEFIRIPDGNVLDNGTPGFNTSENIDYTNLLKSEETIAIWNLAKSLANTYNGVESRYLNESIKAGGLDFSDFCEVHYILKIKKVDNCLDFFNFLQSQN